MTEQNIGFIGGGNMARSLAGGLIQNGWPPAKLHVSDPDPAKRTALESRFGVRCYADNARVVEQADVLVFAVKPQQMRDVVRALAPVVRERRPLVVSIAAGIREGAIQRWLGGGMPIVRVMPNTPALVGSGASGLYANAHVDEDQRDAAESLMRAVGVTVWLDEETLLDIVTALSGSGPAYLLLVLEALEAAAVEAGLARDVARLLVLETAFGTAKMALESQEDPALLRRRVTSPGGTTERALEILEAGDLRGLLGRALAAATERSRELAEMLGRD